MDIYDIVDELFNFIDTCELTPNEEDRLNTLKHEYLQWCREREV